MIQADAGIREHLAGKMAECGDYGVILQCSQDHRHLAFARAACDIWGCPKCQKHQERKYHRRLRPRLEKAMQTSGHALKFVTLTLPGYVDFELKILEAFHKKATKFLQERYKGGLVVLEFSPRGEGAVFLHFHAIVQGGFRGQRSLQKEWSAYLGQKAIVHVRSVDMGGLNYILKYLVKGISGFTSDEMLTIAAAFYKRQRLRSFGTLRHPVPADRLYSRCPLCGASMSIFDTIATKEDLKMWRFAHLEAIPPPEWVTWDEIKEVLQLEEAEKTYWIKDSSQLTFEGEKVEVMKRVKKLDKDGRVRDHL